jgi:XTP/dITP diphosphohydrolase
MKTQILLATRNGKKLNELRRILAPRLSAEVLGLDDVGAYDEVPETGATFAENALLKAIAASEHTGLASVADDSGLAVDALNGMPGVLSARWAGRAAVTADGRKLPEADEANLSLLLEQLADTPDERLGASFICAAALVSPSGVQIVREARMPGRLIRHRRGSHGFGYDPIFVPSRYSVTSAELPPDEKDEISHRGQALRALLPDILEVLT